MITLAFVIGILVFISIYEHCELELRLKQVDKLFRIYKNACINILGYTSSSL